MKVKFKKKESHRVLFIAQTLKRVTGIYRYIGGSTYQAGMNGAAFFCFGAGRGRAGDIFSGRGRDQNSRGRAFSGWGMPGRGGVNNMSTLRSMSYSDSEFSPCNVHFFQLSFVNHVTALTSWYLY